MKISGPAIPFIALVGALFISLILYVVFPPRFEGRIFYYPSNSGESIGAEKNGVPVKKNLDGKIKVFLEDLFVGPGTLDFAPVVPRGTRVLHVFVLNKTIYIDFDSQIMVTDKAIPLSFDQSLQNIRYNLTFNFPRQTNIVFTIEGQQVGTKIPYGRKY